MLAWWRDVAGLTYEEMLPMGGGLRQHRHDMNGSILKVNVSRDPLPSELEVSPLARSVSPLPSGVQNSKRVWCSRRLAGSTIGLTSTARASPGHLRSVLRRRGML
ncbi:MAG: hypothetical protein WEB52_13300 [Dehalococcoidia bacterium]